MERDCESELSKLNIEQNACIYHFGASVIHGQRSNILRLRNLSAYAILHLPHKSPSNQSPTKFDYPKNASRQNLLAEKLLYFHCLFFWEKRFTFLSHYFHLKNLQFKIIHIKNITNRITISPKYSFILYPNQHCFKLFTT